MKIADFKKIISDIKEKTKDISLSKVYIEFTWWTNKFKPLIRIEPDKYIQSYVLIFGSDCCNKTCDNEPCNFYLHSNTDNVNTVIHYPLTLKDIDFWLPDNNKAEFKNIEFTLCSDDIPLNCTVEINPFRTQLFIKEDETAILTFYASDGGSESKKSMKYFNETSIKKYVSKSNCEQTIIGENNK